MSKSTKTYSVKQATEIVGLSRALISRLCQRGEIGTRLDLPEIGQFCYRLSAADLRFLKTRKKTFQKNNNKTDK